MHSQLCDTPFQVCRHPNPVPAVYIQTGYRPMVTKIKKSDYGLDASRISTFSNLEIGRIKYLGEEKILSKTVYPRILKKFFNPDGINIL